MLLLGLKATCGFDNKFSQEHLIDLLKEKMALFSNDDFYQYSLGIIALHVNNADLPVEYGNTLLENVFFRKSRKKQFQNFKQVSQTQALGLVALSAILREKFVSHWMTKHGSNTIKKVQKEIEEDWKSWNNEQEDMDLERALHLLMVSFVS